MRGLPGSGKSTYCKELQAKNPGKYKRVNRDLLREMLDCGVWSKENEKLAPLYNLLSDLTKRNLPPAGL